MYNVQPKHDLIGGISCFFVSTSCTHNCITSLHPSLSPHVPTHVVCNYTSFSQYVGIYLSFRATKSIIMTASFSHLRRYKTLAKSVARYITPEEKRAGGPPFGHFRNCLSYVMSRHGSDSCCPILMQMRRRRQSIAAVDRLTRRCRLE